MAVFVPRTIINGGLLRSFISQNVSLIVHVEEEVALQSRSFVGKTTDDVTVTIQLDDPLNVQVKGWIEVIGVPSGADTIRNKEIIIFPNEAEEPFDKDSHNHLVTFINNCKDIYSTAAA